MEKMRFCKHCHEPFEARRSNHVYCTASCKTKASYKRNNYKYVSGHYERGEHSKAVNLPSFTKSDDLLLAVQSLEKRIDELGNHKGIAPVSVKEAALGTLAADAGIYAAKRLLAPKSLPATKADIESLKEELRQLKNSLIFSRINKLPNNF